LQPLGYLPRPLMRAAASTPSRSPSAAFRAGASSPRRSLPRLPPPRIAPTPRLPGAASPAPTRRSVSAPQGCFGWAGGDGWGRSPVALCGLAVHVNHHDATTNYPQAAAQLALCSCEPASLQAPCSRASHSPCRCSALDAPASWGVHLGWLAAGFRQQLDLCSRGIK
jgi:hypothetical protein